MANITFGVRGDSLSARYSGGARAGQGFCWDVNHTQLPKITADASAIGGSVIDLDTTNAGKTTRGLFWPGYGNIGAQGPKSILLRAKFSTADLSGQSGVISITPPEQTGSPYGVYLYLSGGVLYVQADDAISHSVSYDHSTTWTPSANVWYDIVLTYTGVGAATNAFKLYIDGVLIHQWNSNGGADADSWNTYYKPSFMSIGLGVGAFQYYTQKSRYNELVLWDDVIDPTTIALESGTGLNGAARTSFVAVASFDGSINTGAGAANIRLGQSETLSGIVIPGTMVIPTAAQTQHGVVFDGSTVGTYRGADLFDTLAPAVVKLGQTYNANGVVQTGTLPFFAPSQSPVPTCSVWTFLADITGADVSTTQAATLTVELKSSFAVGDQIVGAGSKVYPFDSNGRVQADLPCSDTAGKVYTFAISYTDQAGKVQTINFAPAQVPTQTSIGLMELTQLVG